MEEIDGDFGMLADHLVVGKSLCKERLMVDDDRALIKGNFE